MFGERLSRYIFWKYYHPRLTEIIAPSFPIIIDYPIKCSPRYGYGKPPHQQLMAILEAGREEYAKRLSAFCSLKEELSQIPGKGSPESADPCWGPQTFFTSLDAVALYGMLLEFRPKRLLEIGSGYSTKFARRAIRKHALGTRITSIDPNPRAEIDKLCDTVIRQPLEELDPSVVDELESGDFLFVDSSHRTFQNSDVTAVFMDVLPRLNSGVVVHFHDIFLPYDYLPEWVERFYSEQYLLGSYVLADRRTRIRVLLPNAFIVHDRDLVNICRPLIEIPGIGRPLLPNSSPFGIGGGSFWMQVGADDKRAIK